MATKPILFNTEMVKAILDGRKSQTRRIAKALCNLTSRSDCLMPDQFDFFVSPLTGTTYWKDNQGSVTIDGKNVIAPFTRRDILWVRETWGTHYDGIHDDLQFCYRADGIDLKAECLPGEWNHWYPSIHMPKEAARIFLRVNGVRVDRLQEITEEDVCAEGSEPLIICDREHPLIGPNGEYYDMCYNGAHVCSNCPIDRSYGELFGEKVWNPTIKKADLPVYGWEANPWVWVIEFERCEKPEGWCKNE